MHMFSLKTLLVWLFAAFGGPNTPDAPPPPSDSSSASVVVYSPDAKRGGIYNGF
jgi:hypothetical protein